MRRGTPPALLWPIYLLFRPETFFACFAGTRSRFTVFLAVLVCGAAFWLDRLAISGLRGQDTSAVTSDWKTYWVYLAVGGAVTALLFYVILGWWYRLRLRFSGAANPDPYLARRVLVFATVIYAVPTVALSIVETMLFDTPGAAERDASMPMMIAYAAVLLLVPWHVYVSYAGVRTLFAGRRWAMRTWFLILPMGVYFSIGTLAGIAAVRQASQEDTIVGRPNVIEREHFSVKYPQTWTVDTDDPDYDPDYYLTMEPPMFDAIVIFDIYDGVEDPVQVSQDTVESYKNNFLARGDEKPILTWGRMKGAGAEYVGTYEGNDYHIRVFTLTSATHTFVVSEVLQTVDAEKLEVTLEFIRSSFQLPEKP